MAVVAAEKLFGSDGARSGVVLGAFADDGVLAGVIARRRHRWIKLLAWPRRIVVTGWPRGCSPPCPARAPA